MNPYIWDFSLICIWTNRPKVFYFFGAHPHLKLPCLPVHTSTHPATHWTFYCVIKTLFVLLPLQNILSNEASFMNRETPNSTWLLSSSSRARSFHLAFSWFQIVNTWRETSEKNQTRETTTLLNFTQKICWYTSFILLFISWQSSEVCVWESWFWMSVYWMLFVSR